MGPAHFGLENTNQSFLQCHSLFEDCFLVLLFECCIASWHHITHFPMTTSSMIMHHITKSNSNWFREQCHAELRLFWEQMKAQPCMSMSVLIKVLGECITGFSWFVNSLKILQLQLLSHLCISVIVRQEQYRLSNASKHYVQRSLLDEHLIHCSVPLIVLTHHGMQVIRKVLTTVRRSRSNAFIKGNV